MNRVRTSFIGLGLPFALLCGLGGCKTEEPQETGDASAQAATRIDPAACVEFAGNSHCSLGAAKVELNARGELAVSGMRTAGKDGVAINLPDVTSFIPKGVYTRGNGTKMLARSINEGVSTSTMSASIEQGGVVFAASFTGAGQASTYSAIYSRNGQEVARISDLGNGQVLRPIFRPCSPWPFCRWEPLPPIFHIRTVLAANATAAGSKAEASGACSWEQRFDPNEPALVTLEDGRTVEMDNLELREEIPAGGSYPYTSFNRIDYTYDGGTLVLSGEELR